MLEDVQLAPEWKIHPGLPGRDYHDPEIWEIEKARIFSRSWYCVGREEQLADAGDYLTHDVADESIVVIRGKDDELRAFANVCRHRGSRLLGEVSGCVKGAIVCPYHAWTYGLEGDLRATPNVLEEDGLPREQYGLYPIALETWQGFVFVSLAERPRPLLDALAAEPDGPLDYDRYRLGELRLAHRIVYEVEANWKIIIDNYNECLHCPSVHPELVSIVPIYRKGEVIEKEGWVGNTLIEGGTSFTFDGHSKLPPLPGIDDIDRHAYYGFALFPTLLINYHSDCVMTYQLWPVSPDRTIVVSEFLFMPETIESANFDPSEVVDFWDLVSRQDWVICERAHIGTRSKAYTSGVFPKQDGLLHEFTERYLKVRGPATAKG
jgi:Rieske 2Fe-2S family protein